MNEIQLDKTETEKFLEAIERSGVLYWLEDLKEDLMQSVDGTDFSMPEVNSVYDLDGMYSDQNIERKAHQIYAIDYAARLCKGEKL
mgnify:CR=1 FL=1